MNNLDTVDPTVRCRMSHSIYTCFASAMIWEQAYLAKPAIAPLMRQGLDKICLFSQMSPKQNQGGSMPTRILAHSQLEYRLWETRIFIYVYNVTRQTGRTVNWYGGRAKKITLDPNCKYIITVSYKQWLSLCVNPSLGYGEARISQPSWWVSSKWKVTSCS